MTLSNDNGTDGQTDRRTDRVRRKMRPPPREEGRIIIVCAAVGYAQCRENTDSGAQLRRHYIALAQHGVCFVTFFTF